MQFDISDYQASLGNQEFGSNVQYIKETHSTNDEIWNHKITSNPLIIITDRQTKGRGRRSNNWFSKKYESLLFSIGIIDQQPKLISQKISIAIADAITSQTQLNPKIKWPNDILINSKKVGGILIEKKKRVVNIGIGINVNIRYNDFPKELKNNMTSLYVETNKHLSREKLLSQIIKSIDYYLNLNEDSTISKWNAMCAHNNSEIKFHHENKLISGIFLGIDSSGSAIIQENQEVNYYSSGVIEL
tara:strand:+ start:199 stop:933 length:735 start_codon:yes stop_codon:yes gene_type:complete